MDARSLLFAARTAQGLTQETAARRSGTSQPTLSAYERGTKSPTLAVTERILRTLGYELGLTPQITFRELQLTGHGRTFHVPDRLWRLSPGDCFAPPSFSRRNKKVYDLTDRADRYSAYIGLLEHGSPEQLLAHVDGALLIDAWPEMVASLHDEVRRAWTPLIGSAHDEWLIAQLRDREVLRRPKPGSRQDRERAIRRMVEHGVAAEHIRAVLDRTAET